MREALTQIVPAVTGFAGLWLGTRLNFAATHRSWVLDNKKSEWRELLDVVQAALIEMADAVYGPAGDPSRSVQRAFIVLNNRMFIADTVGREKLIDRWDEINRYVVSVTRPTYHPNEQAVNSFEHERNAFPDFLATLIRKDLQIR